MLHIRHPQTGFSLLEVLVTLVILSVGLIGLAGLQGTSLKQNYNAYLRSQATALAYDMADRVRANGDGNYHNPTGAEKTACTGTSGCSEADLAVHDMWQWTQDIGALLPLGAGTVCRDSTPEVPPTALACDGIGTTHVVRVSWDDDRDGVASNTNPTETIVIAFRP